MLLRATISTRPDTLVPYTTPFRSIGERTFYPRVALGEYFRDQFDAVIDMARARGIELELRTRCRVEDVVSTSGAMILKVRMRRSEEHTSELKSLMRISYAVFCLKKKKRKQRTQKNREQELTH